MASWAKGQSGNPGGRPKELRKVVALARKRTTVAIKTLEDIMTNGSNEGARVRAAEVLLERGWGKPAQPLEHSGENGQPLGIVVEFVRPDGGK